MKLFSVLFCLFGSLSLVGCSSSQEEDLSQNESSVEGYVVELDQIASFDAETGEITFSGGQILEDLISSDKQFNPHATISFVKDGEIVLDKLQIVEPTSSLIYNDMVIMMQPADNISFFLDEGYPALSSLGENMERNAAIRAENLSKRQAGIDEFMTYLKSQSKVK